MNRVAASSVATALGCIVLYFAGASSATESLQIDVAARSIQPGELALFTASAATPIDTLRVRAFGRDIPAFRVDSRTWQALVGIDLDTPAGPHPVSFGALSGEQPMSMTTTLTVEPKTFATRRLTVDDSFVNPTGAVLERILREAAELRELWDRVTPDRLWDGPFVRPVPGHANSRFGTRSILNDQPRSPHSGVDFLSPAGTPIKAPNSGVVVLARDLYFTGNTVAIDHGLGMYSLFAHLSAVDVAVGDSVETGQTVGKVGATGRVTGAHLHWTVRITRARVDPMAVLAILSSGTQ